MQRGKEGDDVKPPDVRSWVCDGIRLSKVGGRGKRFTRAQKRHERQDALRAALREAEDAGLGQ